MPTTMYVRPLWVGVDCVEVGTHVLPSVTRQNLEARGTAVMEVGLLGRRASEALSLRATLAVRALLRHALRRERRAWSTTKMSQRASGEVLHVDPEGRVDDLRRRGHRLRGGIPLRRGRSEKLEDDLQLADCNAPSGHALPVIVCVSSS